MNMRVKRVGSARETQVVTTPWLTVIRKANRVAVLAHPVAHSREHLHGFEWDRAVLSWTNVQKIIAAVARARNQIANNRRRTLPVTISFVITPTIVQRHARFPRAVR